MLTTTQIQGFIDAHHLPAKFSKLIDEHYSPLASWMSRIERRGEMLLVGISGAQGTGKSTLAVFLQTALESFVNWRIVVLSLDDFYLTKAKRVRLAEQVHPLLQTRGAPGTHDVRMLVDHLAKLRRLDTGTSLRLPRFDTALDDRANEADCPPYRDR